MQSSEPETIKLLSSEIANEVTIDSCFKTIKLSPVYIFKNDTISGYPPYAIKLLH